MGSHDSSSRSAGSKRSRASKKATSGQKTLGMAWGANSKSSSAVRYSSPFSDFASYMETKNRKLRDQFDADASGASTSASVAAALFCGISIFVDGFTVPSSQELKRYMLNYGGRFENYFSRHRVTHIICSNLPNSKLKNLRSFSSGLPVVQPTWILDCVAANRILNWFPYQLNQIASEARNQPKISDLFSLRSNSKSEDADIEVKFPNVGEGGENSAFLVCEKSSERIMEVMHKEVENTAGNCEDFTSHESMGNYGEKIEVTPSHFLEHKEQCDDNACKLCAERISDAENPCSLNKEFNGEQMDNKIVRSCNELNSTSGDRNFVETYFKKSRLHFIGTWRNRYHKRFPTLSGTKYSKEGADACRASRRNYIIHIDMDCFFVSVILRNHPDLLDKPVAVCHSDNPNGTAEISSANYPARDFGIRAGMFVRDAKMLCPPLVIVPYNFAAYEEVADQFYDILHKYCNIVQAISCDEAFLDVSEVDGDDPENIASRIREEIFRITRCTASAGIARNMLMARLATKKAKPNGQCYIPIHQVDDYLINLPIKALPGIGHALAEKLHSRNIKTCDQLRTISKEILQKDFGSKTGEMLWNYSRGIDNREVGLNQEAKSMGAEVNWGVRFNEMKEAQDFLVHLSKEVSLRLQKCSMVGRTVTLKVKKRKKGADEPTKYMGCGDCDNLSHSITVPTATDDVDVLQKISKQLFASFHVDVKEVRGIGLQVSKLESADCANQERQKNAIRLWLASASKNAEPLRKNKNDEVSLAGESSSSARQTSGAACMSQVSSWPPIFELDMKVLDSLPPDIISEIDAMYGGEITCLMKVAENKDVKLSSPMSKSEQLEVQELLHTPRNKGKQPICSSPVPIHGIKTNVEEISGSRTQTNLGNISSCSNKYDLMPSSLSQVDISVLLELPAEVRTDMLQLLPVHRGSKCSSGVVQPLMNGEDVIVKEGPTTAVNNLWSEDPPRWIKTFENSKCSILSILADLYGRVNDGLLSSALQKMNSYLPCSGDLRSDEHGEAIFSFCELLKDYIELKIDSDIEELYLCFRMLNRSARKSEFILHIYNMILPSLQAFVNEHYGGTLHL